MTEQIDQVQEELDDERLRELSHAWQKPYEKALDDFYAQEKPNGDELIDLLWEQGILGRVCPNDPEEKSAREKLGKTVWAGSREDPALYWRILYSVIAAQEAEKKNYSVMAGSTSYIVAVFQGINRAYLEQKFQFLFPDHPDENNLYKIVLEKISQRAKEELAKRGVEPPQKIIPSGAKTVWQGLPITVDYYNGDGTIWLKPTEISPHTHNLLFDLTQGKGVAPEVLHEANLEWEE